MKKHSNQKQLFRRRRTWSNKCQLSNSLLFKQKYSDVKKRKNTQGKLKLKICFKKRARKGRHRDRAGKDTRTKHTLKNTNNSDGNERKV